METPYLSEIGSYYCFDLPAFAGDKLAELPFTLRILLENALRNALIHGLKPDSAYDILNWHAQAEQRPSVPFLPTRVLLQDLTGVPLLVDLAAMRSEMARRGDDPKTISPKIPVDLVIDHSIQVDFHKLPDSLARNRELENQRNRERYQLLRWAQDAFNHFRVVPPGKGIVHQVNLEYLAKVVDHRDINGVTYAFPDTVFGTDSHTPMINGLGVLGWGVGGIEAIAAMLEKPTHLVLPDVIGISFTGQLPQGSTPTDLTLVIVERLRQEGVVGKYIECFGENLDHLSLTDRAMIANMTPETGATVIYFPVDHLTLQYLQLTGRSPKHVRYVEEYCKAQGLFREKDTPQPNYTMVIEIDLVKVKPSLAGPFRPQDRVELPHLKEIFESSLSKSRHERGYALAEDEIRKTATTSINGETVTLKHGSVLIAAITSCTNTSNPSVMLAAGLLAKKAVALGLQINPAVKCSLMPGSQVVTAYLENSGLLAPLAELGFNLVGYGCGTCIGNSGPLAPEIETALQEHPLITVSILSGNRNFEGRINPLTKASFLASPPLVVAYALAGKIDIDLAIEPLGYDHHGEPVLLTDIYPTQQEVDHLISEVQPDLFKHVYGSLYQGDRAWESLRTGPASVLFPWDKASTYITEPPYFSTDTNQESSAHNKFIQGAHVLLLLGDSITTDHISPAGAIPPASPAGEYLLALGISVKDFNSYGARRGNDQVMVRGTFSNIRIKNLMVSEKEGGYTRYLPQGEVMTVYEAAQLYAKAKIPLIVIAGKEYGTGSSRDWAAKGSRLLGIRAIIAESFERIHRANLVGMGVLPLTFKSGDSASKLGLSGVERYEILGLDQLTPQGTCQVRMMSDDGKSFTFDTTVQIQTDSELHSFLAGGILHEALG
jgi:aconitate hydratase